MSTTHERRFREMQDLLGSREYRNSFARWVRGRHQDSDLRALGISDSSASAVVPHPVADQMHELLANAGPIRRLCQAVQYSGSSLRLPLESTLPEAQYLSEGGDYQASPDDGTYSEAELLPYKLTSSVIASDELVADAAFDFPSWLFSNFARRIGQTEESKVISGTGTNEPTGLISQIGTAAVTAASATAVTIGELAELMSGLPAPYIANASWLMSPALWAEVVQYDVAGAIQPSFAEGAVADFLGKPVYLSAHMGGLEANATPVFLGDFSHVVLWQTSDLRLFVSTERFADRGQTFFRAFLRHDAKLVTGDAIVRLEMSA